MHPINKILGLLGLELKRKPPTVNPPDEFQKSYDDQWKVLQKDSRGFVLFERLRYEAGDHPVSYKDYESGFAANHIARLAPENILDVGSHRLFILGLLAHYKVTTLDILNRDSLWSNEEIRIGDVIDLDIPDNTFDVITSLNSLTAWGLGGYGDAFDLNADKKGINHLKRVLKPGGHLIFSTYITRSDPVLFYNRRRIYSHEMIKDFCSGLKCIDEKFFSKRLGRFCSFSEVCDLPILRNEKQYESEHWDIYCGCYQKEA